MSNAKELRGKSVSELQYELVALYREKIQSEYAEGNTPIN